MPSASKLDSGDAATPHEAPGSCPLAMSAETAESLLTRHSIRILIVGIAGGLAFMIWTWARAASMSADGAHYMELAERAWKLGPHAGMDWYAGPGYPVIVSWLVGLLGDLDFAGRLTSLLFGLGTLAGVGMLSFRMCGSSVARLSIALLAVHTTFVRHAVMAETDAAYGCWLVWSILSTWELKHASGWRRRTFWATFAGLSLGIGYLTRPEAVPLAGLLGIWYVLPIRKHFSTPVSAASLPTPSPPNCTSPVARLGWFVFVASIFLIVASPYLLKLHADLGRWSLSGKERSIVLKFVPDKQNYEQVLKLGVTGALLRQPANIVRWLPYHLHWGLPQFGKSLHPVVLVLALVGIFRRRLVHRANGSVGLLLWVSVPFILFFFLTFPGRRYFMQAMPQWTILAAVGTVELAGLIAIARSRVARWCCSGAPEVGSRRAFRIALASPVLVMAASTMWSSRQPIEQSLRTERAVGERIHQLAGPGRRVLSFTVAAFYARGQRVPLWGPMEGIVRCHGYGKPLAYDDFVSYVRRYQVDYVVFDHDLSADCPEFIQRVQPEDFELVVDDVHDDHGPCLVYRYVGQLAQTIHAN